jgi:hypothetical protein
MGVSGQRHAPAALCAGERTPGTHCTGGWVGLRAGLDTEVRGKILCPCRGSNLDRPVVQSIVRHYTDWSTPAPMKTGCLILNSTSDLVQVSTLTSHTSLYLFTDICIVTYLCTHTLKNVAEAPEERLCVRGWSWNTDQQTWCQFLF